MKDYQDIDIFSVISTVRVCVCASHTFPCCSQGHPKWAPSHLSSLLSLSVREWWRQSCNKR